MAAVEIAMNNETTASQVMEAFSVNLEGKIVFITGTSAGLGVETARVMLTAGATVVGAVRNLEKMAPIADELKTSTGNDKLEILQCDLASLASVRACAAAFREKYTKLDIFIANAGVMATAGRRETAEGYEFQFGVDHLGHFLLVGLVIDLMFDQEGGARVVSVSSEAHKMGAGIQFENLQFTQGEYNKWAAYGQAKTANLLFARELNKRYSSRGVLGFSVHPGVIMTELAREMPKEELEAMAKGPAMSRMKTVPQGAATSVFAAVSPTITGQGGSYLSDCQVVTEVVPEGQNVMATIGQHVLAPFVATDENDERLWTVSEGLVGEPDSDWTYPAAS